MGFHQQKHMYLVFVFSVIENMFPFKNKNERERERKTNKNKQNLRTVVKYLCISCWFL